jgi:hypothetical protein
LDVEKVSDRSGSYLFPLRAKKERSTRTTVASPAPLGMAALLARCHLDSSDDGGDDGADIELGFDVDDGVGSEVVPDAGDDSADSSDSSSSSSSSSSDSSSSSSSSSDSDDRSSVEDVIDMIGGFAADDLPIPEDVPAIPGPPLATWHVHVSRFKHNIVRLSIHIPIGLTIYVFISNSIDISSVYMYECIYAYMHNCIYV